MLYAEWTLYAGFLWQCVCYANMSMGYAYGLGALL